MKRYSTYILHCADDSYYTGMTNDLERRINEHHEGINEGSYTADRRPVKLVWSQHYKYVNLAIAREKQIKGWSRTKKKALIEGRLKELAPLSKKNFSAGKK